MKALLYTLFIYSLFFNTSTIFAQGWENTFVDSIGFARGIDVKETSDGGYILAGETDYPTGAIRHYIKAIKTDSEGNPEWNITYGDWNIVDDQIVFVEQLADGKFIFGGSRSNKPFLLQVYSNGDEVWSKIINPSAIGKEIYAGSKTSDQGYILAGWQFGQDTILPKSYVVKTDVEGNILWEQTELSTASKIMAIIETSDQGYLVTGSESNLSLFLIRMDAQGNELWKKEYELSTNSLGASIVETDDGGFIIGGRGIGTSQTFPTLLKVDNEGNVGWVKFLSDLPNGAITDIHSTSDGGYIATGSMQSFWFVQGDTGFAVKLDENGEIEWSEELSPNANISSIQETSDGGFILTGFNSEGILLKKIGGINSAQKIFSPEVQLSVFPNPMNDFTTFKIETDKFTTFQLRIFNSIGQLVRTEQFNNSVFNFYKKNLTTGIYFFEISSKEKLLANGKLEVH